MKNRLNLWQIDSDSRRKIVTIDLRFSVLKRPGYMVQVGANGLARAVRAEQIRTLREEEFE